MTNHADAGYAVSVVGTLADKHMTNDEISVLAVNALMDKISAMVAKGKPAKGLTEDEHAIGLAHVCVEMLSTLPAEADAALKNRTLAVAIRATKNASQMRQVAEKRKILTEQQKGDKVEDLFSKYA